MILGGVSDLLSRDKAQEIIVGLAVSNALGGTKYPIHDPNAALTVELLT